MRQYLLGQLSETDEEQVELRLLADDDYFEQMEIAENELLDGYLHGALTGGEREQMERRFLLAPERQFKLALATALDEESSARAAGRSNLIAFTRSSIPPKPNLFSSIYFKVAAAVIVVVAVSLVVWSLMARRSEVDRGLVALNEAYRQQRPVEARLTGLNYAPAAETRGGASDKFDYTAHDRAARILQDAARAHEGAKELHALGQLYLAEQQYDKAVDQLEAALKSAPDDARLHSDLGAALLERGNHEPHDAPAAQSLDFADSLEHLNRALALDPSLQDALFNRALLYQSMKTPRQAADDWRRYLELDPNSPWATEARRNLKLIEDARGVSQVPSQTSQEFLAAYRAHDDERAWQIMSGSREMITGRMVPLRLARDALEAEAAGRRDEAHELLDALTYAGRLERARADDPFVAELASYYSAAGRDARAQLIAADAELGDGFRLCQASQYDGARTHFTRARALFAAARDAPEAHLTDYWLAYCLSQRDKLTDSAVMLDNLASFCRQHGYRWLLSQSLCRLANCYDLLGDHSRALALDRQALDIAAAISDTYNQQKVLTQIALQYTELGRPDHALDYHQRALNLAAPDTLFPRQDWRNLTYTAQTLYTLKRYDAAAAYEREALLLSRDELRDPGLAHQSYTHLGMILSGMGRHADAIQQAQAGLGLARSLENDPVSQKMIAYSLLQLGHLTRQAGDCTAALARYDDALKLYDGMEIEKLDGYDAHKGRLLCYLKGGDDVATQAELSRVLELFGQSRAEIVEEQNRNSFFDAEQDIYDIAIGYAYARDDKRQAFDYSEQSRARSLLDVLTHGAKSVAAGADSEVALGDSAASLNLDAVQEKLPLGVRLVQYAALKDKLLIWVISRDESKVREQSVSASELNARVLDYVTLLTRNDAAQEGEVTRRAEALYDLLIAPVAPLLEGAREVCIVPDKSLFRLPFAALVAPATAHYLIQDFTLLFAPSASVFIDRSHAATGRAQLDHDETLLSVGNPAFDRAAYPQLPDLPAAEIEAKEVARSYGASALTGARARKAVLTELLPRADVIHFAGHYVADERTPMRSRLLLARGDDGSDGGDALTAAEVFGKQLPRARLVVLSACQTELERDDKGEGMIGIARTFLAAGAPLVVASQWPVDSYATADLMIRFHRLRKEGMSTTAALQRAQQEMLAGANERYRSPYYWAAFLPVGGHADY